MGRSRRALLTLAIGAGITVALAAPAAAQADCYGNDVCEEIEGVTVDRGENGSVAPVAVPAPAVASRATAPASQGRLPVTGGDVVGLTVIGAGLVAAGVAATKASRRRSAPAELAS